MRVRRHACGDGFAGCDGDSGPLYKQAHAHTTHSRRASECLDAMHSRVFPFMMKAAEVRKQGRLRPKILAAGRCDQEEGAVLWVGSRVVKSSCSLPEASSTRRDSAAEKTSIDPLAAIAAHNARCIDSHHYEETCRSGVRDERISLSCGLTVVAQDPS